MELATGLFAFCFLCVCIVVVCYLFFSSYKENKKSLSRVKDRLYHIENDAESMRKAIKKLSENQNIFIKRGEAVVLYRQEETFHKKEEGGK